MYILLSVRLFVRLFVCLFVCYEGEGKNVQQNVQQNKSVDVHKCRRKVRQKIFKEKNSSDQNFLIISFFTYNLTILFLEDILREVPFAPEVLSQISLYTAIFKDIILITIEKMLDFIPNLA